MKRLLQIASWLLPPLFLVVLYSYSLRTWFQQDDFAWLDVARRADTWRDVLRAIFTPAGHGTFRPFSERGFFLVFYNLFGLDPLPWRIWVFATQIGSLTLVNAIMRRLTGSAAAGFLAATLWVVHARLATALSWTSAYMQILCGLCLLAELYLWLRHTETGDRRYLAGMSVVFVLGFGVMETNIVFPALAATHALLLARPYLKKALLLFIPSVIFFALDMHFAPKQAQGPYSMHFDTGMLRAFAQYWRWSVNPDNLLGLRWIPVEAGLVGFWFITVLLGGFVAWSAWRRRWLGVVLAAWYFALLGPVLPLRDHVTEYYLTLPVMALAMLGSWAVLSAFRDRSRMGRLWRVLSVAAVSLFVLISTPAARQNAKNRYLHGRGAEKMILGAARARQLHPDATILLDGVDTDLFWDGVCDGGFRSAGVFDVYLTPGTDRKIGGPVELCEPSLYVLPFETTVRALNAGRAVVYSVHGERLRNITRSYAPSPSTSETGSFLLDAASRASDSLLGPTWYEAAAGGRWMPRAAVVTLPATIRKGQHLILEGDCPEPLVRAGPLRLSVRMEGGAATVSISSPLAGFTPSSPSRTNWPEAKACRSIWRSIGPSDRRAKPANWGWCSGRLRFADPHQPEDFEDEPAIAIRYGPQHLFPVAFVARPLRELLRHAGIELISRRVPQKEIAGQSHGTGKLAVVLGQSVPGERIPHPQVQLPAV